MGSVNPTYNDRIRYTLRSKHLSPQIITEPIGWNDDDKEFARHDKYHGIIAKFSNSLKFIGSGADYIQLILDLYGINEEIELIKDEKHPIDDTWMLSYSGFLDLSTWSVENNQVSVKFNSGGIEQLLKSREGEQVELDRLTTIDGKPITPLNTIDVDFEGRRIFLKTKFEVKPSENTVVMSNQTNGQTRGRTSPVPMQLINRSHENAHVPIAGSDVGDDTWERWGSGTTGNMFFAVSDVARRVRVKFTINFTVNITAFDDINFFRFWFRLAQYENGSNYNFKNHTILYSTDNYWDIQGRTFSFAYDNYINLAPGDSLGLVLDQNMDGENGHSAHLDTHVRVNQCELFLEEDSFQEPTKAKAILGHEMGDRLVTIATGKENAFYSEFLGRTDIGYPVDGKGSLTGFTHGFWVRGFDKLPIPTEGPPKVENMFKPLTTSPKDFFDSMSVVWNTGIGIEKIGFTERVRMEPLSFFYNKNVTIRLPFQVKNVKRSVIVDKYYSSIEVGYEQGGDYEEACGLDEYNTKATLTTVIDRIKNVFTRISKFRADMYGLEFTRRKQKSLNDTEDTSRDNHIWMLDLKRGPFANVFKQRKWQDDLSQVPTGVFSPETATNLRFSPVNCLLRHSWWLSASFVKYLTDKVRYGSSTANSKLKTKIRTDSAYSSNPNNIPGNGNEYSENGDIVNSEFQAARFVPEEIEFEHVCDFEVMQKINGTTIILGKEIPNVYGLIEFINEKNEIERGFLMNLKPNGKGQWKLLKANR